MIITVFIINESVQIVYYNVTKAKENKSSGSQTTPPPQNFGRWNVFIAVQKKKNIQIYSKNAAWLRVKTLSSPVLMYSYVPNKYYLK